MSRWFLVSSLVSCLYCFVQGQSQCTTPKGESGQCISLYDCKPLLDLVRSDASKADTDLLRQSVCGYQKKIPKVCCPPKDLRCFNSEGNEGICQDVMDCDTIKTLFTTQRLTDDMKTLILNSRCDPKKSYAICCGPVPSRVSQPNATCTLTTAPPDPRIECCGIDSFSGNKIFGGTVAAIDQYPWLVIIEYIGTIDKKIKLMCGGALISGKYVLTASHCVKGPVLDIGRPANVRLGDYNITNEGLDCMEVEGGGFDCTNGAVIMPIEKVIAHPDYDPNSQLRRHDIALLRLLKMASYSDFIRPICLPTSDISKRSDRPSLYAAGWGAVSDEKSSSNIKLHVDLPFLTHGECQPSYNMSKFKIQLWEGQICAGGEKGKDSCKGDSGGPLMFTSGSIYEVVGIVSFGPTPCGTENVPGVYTNVYQYLPWIRSQIKP